MAVVSPDRESILLGRQVRALAFLRTCTDLTGVLEQRVWPKQFYSCLAGFIESGGASSMTQPLKLTLTTLCRDY